MEDRVVITGMGIVSAIGVDVESFWESLHSGFSGIKNVEQLRLNKIKSKIGGQISYFQTAFESIRAEGWDDRGLQLSLFALKQALQQAKVEDADIPFDRIGVVVGTCSGGIFSGQKWVEECNQLGPSKANPQYLKMYDYNTVANMVSYVTGARGPVLTISTACAASNNAIGLASDLIRSNKVDMVIVGGFDALSETVYNGFNSVDALDTTPCKPYSADRRGLSLGEGAGFLILERMDRAQQRNVNIYAEILGYGLAADGYHPTAPHPEGEGAARAISFALKDAGIAPKEVDYINGHGTGTLLNDVAETKGIIKALGEHAYQIPINSIKAMTGHTLGASGTIEGISTILAINKKFIPPTIRLQSPDPSLTLDYTANVGRKVEKLDIALSNSFAFGGNNAVVAYGSPHLTSRYGIKRKEKVVITGMGLVTPAGIGKEPFFNALISGETILSVIDDAQKRRSNLLNTVHINGDKVKSRFDRKEIRRLDDVGVYSLLSVKEAIEDAGLLIDDLNRERIGVISSHSFSMVEHFSEMFKFTIEDKYRLKPSVFPNSVHNGVAGVIATHLQVLGPSSTMVSGESSSAAAIIHAYELLQKGAADVILCVGADVVNEEVSQTLYAMGIVSNELPRPFDRKRNGALYSEEAVTLVLETESHALARGACILARIHDYAAKSDGTLPWNLSSEGDALVKSMQEVLKSVEQVPDCIWTDASGSITKDFAEAKAISKVFKRNELPYLVAVKAIFGETWAASTNLNIAAALLAMERQVIPGIPNFDEVDSMLNIEPRSQSIGAKTEWALVNSINQSGNSFSFLLGPSI